MNELVNDKQQRMLLFINSLFPHNELMKISRSQILSFIVEKEKPRL